MPTMLTKTATAMLLALSAKSAVAAPANDTKEGTTVTSDAQESAAIIRVVRDTIRDNYVLTEKVPAVLAALDHGLQDGRYRGLRGSALAERINRDLTDAAHDKHLAIQFDPAHASMMNGPLGDEITEGPQWDQMARSMNHGVAELRLLDGNVRYMNLVGFAWTGPKSAAVLDNAMRFLGEGDAIIIDLRYNGGGSPKPIQYIFSHFVEAGTPLMTFRMGGNKPAQTDLALSDLPAGRMLGKPVYVLTSKMSISAAEAFAQLVKDYKVGEVVGETTAGAAYRNSLFPIAEQYMLSVSVGRGDIGPSKFDWEGVGIAPTIKAGMAEALDAAHLAALRKIALTGQGPQKMMAEAKVRALNAKLSPQKATHALAVYAGRYQDRVVTVEGDALFGQRSDGPKTRLLPVGGDAFIMESDPMTTVQYAVTDGHALTMEVIRGDGSRQMIERTK
jgi:hypothetical protein